MPSSVGDRRASPGTSDRGAQPSFEAVACESHVPLNMTAPISRLPVELLQTIFRIAFPIRKKAHAFKILQITHVCRYWRAAAHSCTGFWSNIFIDDTTPAFVTCCLELAGGQPLNIYINLEIMTTYSRAECRLKRKLRANDVDSINLLFEHPERVQTLDITAPFGVCGQGKLLAPIFDACRTLFPYVNRLGWTDVSWTDISLGSDDIDSTIPYSLPRLKNLTLLRHSGTPVIDEVFGLKSLGWMAENVSARRFVELLRRNEGLESITMRGCTYHVAPDDPLACDPQPVSLPNLKSLGMSDCIETTLYLNAPLLSSLPILRVCYDEPPSRIGFWSSSPDNPNLSLRIISKTLDPSVATKLAPFWRGVTTFGLHRSAIPHRHKLYRYPEEIADIWKLLPRLLVLEVTWSHGLDGILQPLFQSADLCPALSRIEVSPSSELMDDRGALEFFSKFLESRAARGKHLSEIVLNHKMNSDGSPKELVPVRLRDWFSGYSYSPEEAAYHPSSHHLGAFWAVFSERCRGFLRQA